MDERLQAGDKVADKEKSQNFSVEIKGIVYTVSDVASELKTSVSCVRQWERYFGDLLESKRSAGNYRLFTPRDIKTLKKVKRLYQSGFYTTRGIKAKLTGQKEAPEETLVVSNPPDKQFFELQEKLLSHLNLLLTEFQHLRREMREDIVGNIRADIDHLKLLLAPRRRTWWRFW